jgi:drug/metabolite transporter (DMT)-like permease
MLVFAGVVLLIGWVIYLRSTVRSLGEIGTFLAIAFFAALTWVLIDYNVLSVENTTVLTYVILTMLSAIMATGMSWSHIRRRMSGQLDVDDVDDD